MTLEIEWSPEAKKEYSQLLEYLEAEWGVKAVLDFITHTKEILGMIVAYPGMYPRVDGKSHIRKCVLHPQTTMFYSFDYQKIMILSLWQNRRNPDDLNQ